MIDRRTIVTGRRRWGMMIMLLAVALPPRLARLDDLSFHGDEETTSFPARALASGDGAVLPSGMAYRRALPLTWLNALSATVFGLDSDRSYRIPSALIGAATVPVLFEAGQYLVGGPAALVAAGLLAVSEWHIAYSRYARAYTALVLFFLITAVALWRWAITARRRHLALAAAAFVSLIMFHRLGQLVVVFAVLPLCFVAIRRVTPWPLLVTALVGSGFAWAYHELFVLTPYIEFGTAPSLSGPAPENVPPADPAGAWRLVRMIAGGLVGATAVRLIAAPATDVATHLRAAGFYGLGVGLGALAFAGHLYGAAMATVVLALLHPTPRREIWTRARWPLLVLTIAVIANVGWVFSTRGVANGLWALGGYPFPYLNQLLRLSPGLTLLFGVACLPLMLRHPRGDEGARVCAASVWLMLGAVGAASQWGGSRYLFPVYPFMLLAVGYAVVGGAQRVQRWFPGIGNGAITAVIVLIVGSGVVSGHGARSAWRVVSAQPGDRVSRELHMFSRWPDHEGAGRFLRGVLAPDDGVIAEDPLQQSWYAGRADYWLRHPSDIRSYLREMTSGDVRDIYVGSRPLLTRSSIDSVLANSSGRIWLVTSAETADLPRYFLNGDQRAWKDSVTQAVPPAFLGRDSLTAVYCVMACRAPMP